MNEEIRCPSGMPVSRSVYEDWKSDIELHVVTHLPSGCRFHIYREEPRRVDGFVVPFGSNELIARLVGMEPGSEQPSQDEIVEIGRMGIGWVTVFTFHARPKGAVNG
jgi:hypothetical protein